jgi:predicted RNase H-like nuclease (RuvC/YqgF family)
MKELKEKINKTKTKIRHLEIELDYIESKEPYNYKYIRILENQIDELYKNLENLDENN